MIMPNNSSRLRNSHLNARSPIAGFDVFVWAVLNWNFHIVCISETWLSESVTNNAVNIPGYILYRKDRAARGGGLAICVSAILFLSPKLRFLR